MQSVETTVSLMFKSCCEIEIVIQSSCQIAFLNNIFNHFIRIKIELIYSHGSQVKI